LICAALAIMVINKDPTRAREATIRLEGFRPAGRAQVWRQDKEHLAAEWPTIAVAKTFSHTLPSYSATLFVVSPAAPAHWPVWVGIGLAIAALAAIALLGYRIWGGR
jgi:hypothetical protein